MVTVPKTFKVIQLSNMQNCNFQFYGIWKKIKFPHAARVQVKVIFSRIASIKEIAHLKIPIHVSSLLAVGQDFLIMTVCTCISLDIYLEEYVKGKK